MSTPTRGKRGGSIIMAALAVLLALAPGRSTAAVASPTVPTSAITGVFAIGLTSSHGPVYVASSSGLYRSVSPTFSLWTRQSTNPNIYALSANPTQPNDLLYAAGSPQEELYRSTDGGRTATLVDLLHPNAESTLARAPDAPSIVYAAEQIDNGLYAISKTVDDGLTWTTVLSGGDYYLDPEGYGPLAIDAHEHDHVVAALRDAHAYGALYETYDGGRTWHSIKGSRNQGMPVSALGFNPSHAGDFWVAWGGLSGGFELDHGLAPVPNPLFQRVLTVSDLQFDPLTGRLYVAAYDSTTYSGRYYIFASGDGGVHFEPFAATDTRFGSLLAVTGNGYLLSAVNSYPGFSGGPVNPLVVRPLIGPGNWRVAPELARGATTAARVLGRAISPRTLCSGAICQYFENGALVAQRGGSYAYGYLVAPLMKARARLPIGGAGSTVTYQTLAVLHRQRVAPPAGFRGGTRRVPGGTFVPYSARLTAAPGYVVPPVFWAYLTNPHVTPGGWLHDIGLPLTNALTTTAPLSGSASQTLVLQAFERAILMYHPSATQTQPITRASIGVDFASAFPQAVR